MKYGILSITIYIYTKKKNPPNWHQSDTGLPMSCRRYIHTIVQNEQTATVACNKFTWTRSCRYWYCTSYWSNGLRTNEEMKGGREDGWPETCFSDKASMPNMRPLWLHLFLKILLHVRTLLVSINRSFKNCCTSSFQGLLRRTPGTDSLLILDWS